MTKEQAADKLKKLKALAERGVGGERESALKLYHKLLEKYQIDEGEILEERVTLHWFSYKTELEEDLLTQIFYKVTGSPSYHHYTGNYSRRKKRGCNCTEIEAVEIKMLFDFYRQELKRELEAFLIAFKQGNNLYPDKNARCYQEYDGPDRELEGEELRKYKKAAWFRQVLDKRTPPRALIGETGGKKRNEAGRNNAGIQGLFQLHKQTGGR